MERKLKILTSLIGVDLVILTAVLAARGIKNSSYLKGTDADANYHIVLNKNNRIEEDVASSTYVKNTDLGNPVSFLYTNCSQNNNYHAVINAGGSIKNTSQISGIEKITPVFSGGELKFRASFDGENWGDYATLKSGYDFSFLSGSLPNYIELVPSESDISLQSIDFAYNCVPTKTEAFEKVTSSLTNYDGKYLIVDETTSKALKTVNGSENTFDVTISNNQILRTTTTDEHTITFTENSSGKYTIKSPSNQYLDYSTSSSTVKLWWDSEYSSNVTFENNLFEIKNSTHYLLFETDHFSYYSTDKSSGRLVSLYKANFEGGAAVPKYLCGLDLNDSKATKYRIGDTFSEFVGGKGLNVSLVYSNGEKVALTTDQFTYVIKNGETTISSTTPFENVGDYKVYVSYGTVLTKSYDIKVDIVNNPTLVTSINDLEDDGKYILACNTQDAVSGDISGTNTYLDSVDATFSEDKSEITDYDDDKTVIFTLNESGDNWTLSNDDGELLYSTGAKKVIWNSSSGTSTWTISISSTGTATIGNTTTSYGKIYYNSGNPRFTTYTSAQTSVQLYKVSSTVDPTKVQSVSVSGENTVQAGSTITLSATVLPDTATNKNVNWTSSNTNVATVNSSGVVTGLVAGTTTITATSAANSKKFGSLAITVTPDPSKVASVSISPSSTSVEATKQVQLSASVLPTTATDKVVTWESSNTAIATVNSSGLVTGVAAGTTTIKAKSHQDSTIYGSCSLTVTPDSSIVTSVTVSPSTATIVVGNTKQLSASVLPTTASDTTVTWSSSDSSIATVSSAGLVTAVKEGSATITAKSNQNNSISGSCAVTVGSTPSGTSYSVAFKHNSSDSSTALTNTTFSSEIDSGSKYVTYSSCSKAYGGKNGLKLGSSGKGGNIVMNVSSTISSSNATSITYTTIQYSTKTTTTSLYINGTSVDSHSTVGTFTYTCAANTKITSIKFASSDERVYIDGFSINCVPESPVNPTGISIPSTANVGKGSTTSLTVTYSPSNCNQNKGVSWSSSNTGVATVSSTGVITGVSTGTATITATSTYNSSFTSSCTVTVTEQAKDAWTIMIYMCGSSLEYDSGSESAGYASADLKEILSANIPTNPTAGQKINILVQTGGIDTSGNWSISSSYLDGATSISATKTQRWEVSGSKLHYLSTNNTSTISSQSELNSFLDWGIEQYPAERTGVIMWDHGGGIAGCLNDYASGKYLKNSDIAQASKQALNDHSSIDKFDFIAYDCCLMGCADIASVNADSYKYMVGSQETEYAGGYDYDEWLKVLKNNPTGTSTVDLCDSIAQTFLQEQCYDYSNCGNCLQTNAVYDLSKMSTLVTDFNAFATSLGINSSGKFANLTDAFETALSFGEDSDGSLFGLCDFVDLMNKLATKFSVSATTVINDAKDVVVKNYYCKKYGTVKPCGLNAFVAHAFNNTEYPIQVTKADYQGSYSTKFTVWQTIMNTYGEYYDS